MPLTPALTDTPTDTLTHPFKGISRRATAAATEDAGLAAGAADAAFEATGTVEAEEETTTAEAADDAGLTAAVEATDAAEAEEATAAAAAVADDAGLTAATADACAAAAPALNWRVATALISMSMKKEAEMALLLPNITPKSTCVRVNAQSLVVSYYEKPYARDDMAGEFTGEINGRVRCRELES